jgi:hypothetical protein
MSSRRRRIINDLMVSSAVFVFSALRNRSSSDSVLLDTRIEVIAVATCAACGMQYMKSRASVGDCLARGISPELPPSQGQHNDAHDPQRERDATYVVQLDCEEDQRWLKEEENQARGEEAVGSALVRLRARRSGSVRLHHGERAILVCVIVHD